MSTVANSVTQKSKISTVSMVQLALLSAIIVVLSATPLGLINLGIINATIIHVPVIIGAILLGPKAGAFLGFIFGLTSMIKNTFYPNLSSFVFTPFYSVGEQSGNLWSLVICFIPRILVGVVAAYVFIWIAKFDKSKIGACIAAGLLGSITNTILVMGGIYLFFGPAYSQAQGIAEEGLFLFIAGIVGTVGIPEAIVAAVLSCLVARPLMALLRKIHR